MTDVDLDRWVAKPDTFFVHENAFVPLKGQMTSVVCLGFLILFAKFFDDSLRFPCSSFAREVLDLFGPKIQHVTLKTHIQLSIFEWSFWMGGGV